MRSAIALAALAAALCSPARALAATITIGSDLSRPGTPNWCTGQGPGASCTLLQLALGGTDQAVPADGVITSWSTRDASGALALRVLDGPPGARFVAAAGPPVQATGAGVQTFSADVPVRRGQRVAVELGTDGELPIAYRGPLTTGERYVPPLGATPEPPDPTADVARTYELLYQVTIEVPDACPTSGVVAHGDGSVVFRAGGRLFACRAGRRTPLGRGARLFRFNGDALALARGRSAVEIFDLARAHRTFRARSSGRITALVVTPTGNAAWMTRRAVWIRFGRHVKQIDSGRFRPRSLRLSPDGTSVEYTTAAGRTRQSGFD
jgi:hypothetical protein